MRDAGLQRLPHDRVVRAHQLLRPLIAQPLREGGGGLDVCEEDGLQGRRWGRSLLVAADGRAKQTPVRAGARRLGRVEILEGLAAGDRVVTEGLVKLRDGAPVSEATATAGAQ